MASVSLCAMKKRVAFVGLWSGGGLLTTVC